MKPVQVRQTGPSAHVLASVRRWAAKAPRASSVLRWLLTFAALGPVGYTVYRQRLAVQNALLHVQWSWLLLSLVLLFAAMPLMGVIPWLTLKSLKVPRSFAKIARFYFVSQLTKYLPGGIWAYPSRVMAYQLDGVGSAQAVVSVAREVILLFLGAALLALITPFVDVSPPLWMQLLVLTGGVLGLAGMFLMSLPRTSILLSRLSSLSPLKEWLNQYEKVQVGLQAKDLLPPLLTSGVYWSLAGMSFLCLVRAVCPTADLSALQAISLFALSWCVGFLIVVLPAGFGARETAILYLLYHFTPLADAATISLLARLSWMAMEAIWTILFVTLLSPRAGTRRPDCEEGK